MSTFGNTFGEVFAQKASVLNVNQPEVETYITGLTTPLSASQKTKLNTLVGTIKTGLGDTLLSDSFDTFYIRAGETSESSLKNIVADNYHATLAGTPNPSFVDFQGFHGDGSHGYIKTGYKPKTHGSKFTLNSASIGVYNRTLSNTVDIEYGCRDSSSVNRTFLEFGGGTTEGAAGLSINSNTGASQTNTRSQGLIIGSRTANNVVVGYFFDHVMTASTTASSGMPDYEITECALNTGGTVSLFSANELAITFTGRGFTANEIWVIQNAIDNYMISNGKDVVWNDSISKMSSYCWFTSKKAVYSASSDKTFIGHVHRSTVDGYTQHITELNNADNSVITTKVGNIYAKDDHNEPSILILPNGKLFTAYSGHGVDNFVRYRTSTNVLDSTSWGVESTYESAGIVSYCSTVQTANGNIYIFYRDNSGWCYIKSTDGGVNFGSRVMYFFGIVTRGYVKICQSPLDANIIHVVVSSTSPEQGSNTGIYAFYVDLSTDKIYKLDGTETTANIPFDAAVDMTLVMASTDPDSCWIEDVTVDSNGYPRYLMTFYPSGRSATFLPIDLYYAEWNGSAITTPYKLHTALTTKHMEAMSNSYSPLSCFNINNPDEIIASKEVSTICELFKLTRVASNNFTSVAKTTSSLYDNWRPFTVNNTTENNVFWLKKVFYNSYTSYLQSLKMGTI
jgi:hypothetical protein